MTRAKRFPKGSWGELLQLCQTIGTDKVLATLQREHERWERLAASLWADPATYNQARKVQARCLQQDETMIRLANMTDADIEAALAQEVA